MAQEYLEAVNGSTSSNNRATLAASPWAAPRPARPFTFWSIRIKRNSSWCATGDQIRLTSHFGWRRTPGGGWRCGAHCLRAVLGV